MKKIILILLLSASFQLQAQRIPSLKIDSVLNRIRENSNKTVIVNFWATFCKPCLEEIPDFVKISKTNDNVKLILVSLDDKDDVPKKIISAARKSGFDKQTILWLNETDADYFCPKIDSSWSGSIPATLIINNKTGYRKFIEDKINAEDLKMYIDDSLGK